MNSEVSDRLDEYTASAKAIAWDNCHKIYILMDDEQVELMRQYGYDPLITSDEMTPEQMLEQVLDWYEDSCGLRFVNAVHTNPSDPNEGFIDIIPQGFGEDDEEDEE
jgi:hypothetical protein